MPEHDTIKIFFGHEDYEVSQPQQTGSELRRLFRIPPADNLYRAKGSKVDGPLIADDEIVQLKNGDHFTSAPRDVTGGASEDAALPPRLRRELEAIRDAFGEVGPVELQTDVNGQRWIQFRSDGHGWKPDPVLLAIRVPLQYPDEQPDLLFVQAEASGPHGVPRAMGQVPALGRTWTQISWHLTGTYDPNRRNLAGFASSARLYLRADNP